MRQRSRRWCSRHMAKEAAQTWLFLENHLMEIPNDLRALSCSLLAWHCCLSDVLGASFLTARMHGFAVGQQARSDPPEGSVAERGPSAAPSCCGKAAARLCYSPLRRPLLF